MSNLGKLQVGYQVGSDENITTCQADQDLIIRKIISHHIDGYQGNINHMEVFLVCVQRFDMLNGYISWSKSRLNQLKSDIVLIIRLVVCVHRTRER